MEARREDSGAAPHIPVLFQEVLTALQLRAGRRIIDGTVGAGGHAAGILAASSPDGLLLGLDRDPAAVELAKERLAEFGSRAIVRYGSFAEIGEHAAAIGWGSVHGVFLDLGLSTMQLEDPKRGFSFRVEGPLDMRFDPYQEVQAADLVNGLDEVALAELIRHYGEEPRAKRIAKAIASARPLSNTRALASLIERIVGPKRRRIHPATRTFQALRIAVNQELDVLKEGLEAAVQMLRPKGRLVVISFHSLEDRIVKQFFVEESKDCICPPEQPICTCDATARLRVITRKPIRPSEEEVGLNPRARSAKMRVAEKTEVA
jgi:16S rRNA (cytosine1402-N4)-methyltransferase